MEEARRGGSKTAGNISRNHPPPFHPPLTLLALRPPHSPRAHYPPARSMPLAACKVIKNMGTGNSRAANTVALGFLLHRVPALSAFLLQPLFSARPEWPPQMPQGFAVARVFYPLGDRNGWKRGMGYVTMEGERRRGLDIWSFRDGVKDFSDLPPVEFFLDLMF